MYLLEPVLGAAVVIYVAVCFGAIAAKHGKNPILYGFFAVFFPVNLFVLGYWAFSNAETDRGTARRRVQGSPGEQ
jgi:high-affinity Fe2+/Pb2+ permease